MFLDKVKNAFNVYNKNSKKWENKILLDEERSAFNIYIYEKSLKKWENKILKAKKTKTVIILIFL